MVTHEVRDYASALEFLLGRVNYERTSHIPYQSDGFKLDRMRTLLGLVGDPHLGLKAVHLAGTKGKGSTAAMIASVLTAAGYRTGLYTSPHLERIEERFAIDGAMCPPERIVALAAQLQDAVAQLPADSPPTFFEVTTALAFLHFADSGVEAAVLEVGLGGRLDSTNVCQPEVTVITSISFDHVRQLGNTLAAIAGEKAGIIKPGVPVVSGVVNEEPRRVIAERARELGAPLFQRGVDFDFERRGLQGHATEGLDYWERGADALAARPAAAIRGLSVPMAGRHQAANAAGAVAALLRLRERGWDISEAAIRGGLSAARCPGRIEFLAGQPTTIIDVAHNPASIAALLEVLEERLPGGRKVLIFASSKDKDFAAMLRLVLPRFAAVVLTQYVHNPRAMEAGELAEVAKELLSGPELAGSAPEITVAPDPEAALAEARKLAGKEGVLCITGSFFLAAELRPLVAPSTVEVIQPPPASLLAR